MSLAIQIVIAFIIDLLLGDPKGYPHPVKIIAHLANGTENLSRKLLSNHKLAGIITTITIVVTSFLVVWLIIQGMAYIHPSLGWATSIYFIYLQSICFLFHSLPKSNKILIANINKIEKND